MSMTRGQTVWLASWGSAMDMDAERDDPSWVLGDFSAPQGEVFEDAELAKVAMMEEARVDWEDMNEGNPDGVPTLHWTCTGRGGKGGEETWVVYLAFDSEEGMTGALAGEDVEPVYAVVLHKKEIR